MAGAAFMIHERLQSLDIKITELASYLKISRPTLYKFIESYDRKERENINKSVLKVFDYVMNNELVDKRNVIGYILANATDCKSSLGSDEQELLTEIRNYLANSPNPEKTSFIKYCIQKNNCDIFIHYLMEIRPLLSKKKLSSDEKKLLQPYKEIVDIYTK